MENTFNTTTNSGFANATVMHSGETFTVGSHELPQLVTVDVPKETQAVQEWKGQAVDRISDVALSGDFTPREVLEKNAEGEFDRKESDHESYLDQVIDETKQSWEKNGRIEDEIIIPTSVLQSEDFRSILIEEAKKDPDASDAEIEKRAYDKYYEEKEEPELAKRVDLHEEIFHSFENNSFQNPTAEQLGMMEEILYLKNENRNLAEELLRTNQNIFQLQNRLMEISNVLMAHIAMEQEKKKKDEKKRPSLLELLFRLIGFLLEKIFADIEEIKQAGQKKDEKKKKDEDSEYQPEQRSSYMSGEMLSPQSRLQKSRNASVVQNSTPV